MIYTISAINILRIRIISALLYISLMLAIKNQLPKSVLSDDSYSQLAKKV